MRSFPFTNVAVFALVLTNLAVLTLHAQKAMVFSSVERYSHDAEGIWIIEVNRESEKDDEIGRIYNVKVIQTLKGEANSQTLSVVSPFGRLYPGDRYLCFGFCQPYPASNLSKIWMDNGSVSPIEIPNSFPLASLEGESLTQKIRSIMQARAAEIDNDIEHLAEEKKSLTEGLKPK